MSTLVDYIKWMGNIDFSARPMSDPDIVILTLLSYFDLTPLFKERPEIYVRDIRKLIDRNKLRVMVTGKDTGAAKILEAAVGTRRFGDLKITDYVDIFEKEEPFQFAAMTIREGRRFAFISYRGTDDSIAGWKEDFMISFTRTKAQEMALEYAKRTIEYGPDWYLAGHSKGGNSALYAACLLPEDQWESVKHVYLLDSPGFCPEVMDTGLIERVDSKATRILPEFSLVGRLFEPAIEDVKIVKSDLSFLMQHAPNSWLVDHGKLQTVPRYSESSTYLHQLVTEWIEELPVEERPLMTEELFSAFEKSGAKNLSDLTPEAFLDAVFRLRRISPTTKKNLGALPAKALLDGVKPDSKIGAFAGRIFSSYLLLGLLLIVLGVSVFFISDRILEVVSLLLVISATVLQIALIIRRLIKAKGRTEGLRERIFIAIILVSFLIILLVKESAMFFMGSLIFGVLFLVLAYVTGERVIKKTENRFIKVLSVIESILSLFFGFSFLLIPSVTVKTYAVSISIVLVADGLARLIYLFINWLKRRK